MELQEKHELYSQGKTCLVGLWGGKCKIGAGYVEVHRQIPKGLCADDLGESHENGAQMGPL